MKPTLAALLVAVLACRGARPASAPTPAQVSRDSAALISMIAERERGMIAKDLDAVARQFGDDMTFLTANGRFYEGKASVTAFHKWMLANDTLDYTYTAGKPRVRVVDAAHAIVYYPWKMTWFRRGAPADTLLPEIGIMTLTAERRAGEWRWIAVTNQHTRVFIDSITAQR